MDPPVYEMEDDDDLVEEHDLEHDDQEHQSGEDYDVYGEDVDDDEDVNATIEADDTAEFTGAGGVPESDGTQNLSEEQQEEQHDQDEQEENEDGEGGDGDGNQDDDEDVRTFLEFTGSSDRHRARQYLTATEGNLEEAVNLFLSGAPPPVASNNNSPPRREAGFPRLRLGGSAEASLPHLLAHLEALANGEDSRLGEGQNEDQHVEMDALLTDLTGNEVNLSALARSLMVGPGFSDFMRLAQTHSPGNGPLFGTHREGSDAHQDDELYENPDTTLSDAQSRLEAVARGQMDAVSVVGAHVTRSVASLTTYMNANVIQAITSALGKVSSDSAVRVLQVIEGIVLMLCRGLDETERLTVGWFVPPRRLGSNPRRGRPKSWALETFTKTISPKGDIALARRLWRRRELEPDFKDAAGDGLLAIACIQRAPVEFLCYLASVWALDPSKGDGSSGTPIAILRNMISSAKEKGESDTWAESALDALQNAYTPSEKDHRMAPMPLSETDTPSSDLCSPGQWVEITMALLKFVSRSSNVAAVRRALEIIVLIAEECPTPRVVQLPAIGALVAGALAPESKDKVVFRCGLRILKALADNEGTDGALVNLVRGGVIHKFNKRTMESENDNAVLSACLPLILERVEGKCDFEGRSEVALKAANALRARSGDAIDLLSRALTDITTFEFEQCSLAEAANVYFSDPNVPPQELLRIVEDANAPGSSMKRWRGNVNSTPDVIESDEGEDLLTFTFTTSVSSSGSGSVRFRRARHDNERRGNESRNRSSKSTGKVTILERLVDCARAVFNESVPQGLPQIINDFPGKEEGVRALLNTIPIKLVATPDLRKAYLERANEFNMHALPLTSRHELDKQVLRTGLIPNKRYLEYCRQLVGKKVALIVQDAATEMHLCTGFDSKLGAHRLQSLLSHQQHWRIMAASKYAVLERVFDADDAEELRLHDESDADCPENGALESAEVEITVPDENQLLSTGSQAEEASSTDEASKLVPVAVWWEGSSDLRPGWRLGLVQNRVDNAADLVEVTFPCAGLLFDDEIRVGSLVRLVASEELQRHPDLAQHLGESARVISISGTQVTTYGLGGNAINSSLLARVRDPDEDGTSRKPQVGESVAFVSVDGTRLERGTILSNDGTRFCFTVEDEATHETRKLAEKDVHLLLDTPSDSIKIPARRIIPLSAVPRTNQDHAFAVYIIPGSVSGDVPDFDQLSNSSPQPRVLFAITSEGDSMANNQLDWSSDEEDSSRNREPQAPRIEHGARIEARYAGKSRWYKGYVSRVNADGTYDIAYDDGDTERCVAPSLVAFVSGDEDAPSGRPGSATGQAMVQYDFRKVFPTLAGRALFDSLRREDHVLRTEYNFVTRGFEHQPNFYSSFAATLEHLGAGVFAQFQTFQQADELFVRCNKFAKEAGPGDRVVIRFEPDRRPHPTVIREVLSAFAKAEFQRASSSTANGSLQMPKPGSRALVRIGPDAKTQSMRDASKVVAWVSGTVLAHNQQIDGEEAPSAIVCTDDGMLFRRVPVDHVKEAPTRAPVTQSSPQQQPSSRRLFFRSGSRSGSGGNNASNNASNTAIGSSPPRLDTPVELTRQFSVFGQTNALRHITVGERSPASSRFIPQAGGMPGLALSSASPGPQALNSLAALPGRPENQPPKLVVQIEAGISPDNRGIALVDEDNEDGTSVFRLIFESLYNDKKNISRSNVLRARWSFVSGGIRLMFRTKTLFPGDPDTAEESAPKNEEDRLSEASRAALDLMVTLNRRSQGANSVDWVNTALSNHLRTQLRDPLSVATRVFPRWVQTLLSRAYFLFLEKDRVAFVKAVTLGVSRSIAWLQEEVTGYQSKKRELAQLTVEISQLFNQAEPNEMRYKRLSQQFEKLDDEVKQIKETKFIGQLRQDLVKVNAASLLDDAMALMENHAGERSELVVQFVGDTGAGEGVTHEFYGAVAAELQKVAQNKAVPMWADPMRSTRGDSQADLIRPLGLFPHPLLPAAKNSKRAEDLNQAILDRFRFLGRLMGQALLDERTVPLPLAVEFFELLRDNGPVSFSRVVRLIESDDSLFAGDGRDSSLDQAETDSGGIISVLSRLVTTLDDPNTSPSMKQAASQALETRLSEMALRFVDPSQPFAEVKKGKTSASGNSTSSSGGANNCEVDDSTEICNVPLVDAPYPAVLAFANEWSEKGKTKAQIDRALESAGHSKLARWRVLQATQAARVISATTGVDDDEDIIERYDVAAELIPDGRKVIVDMTNVRQYLAAVQEHWTSTGIMSQIDATRHGLEDALGTKGAQAMLRIFSADALMRLFCGEQEVKWNENDPLLGFLLPKGEYSSSAREIKMLVECLNLMNQTERSQFLSFCTALPRVPSSGLPQIKVFPPTKSRVTALIISTSSSDASSGGDGSGGWDSQWPRLSTGDHVMLADGYRDVEDAANGPLKPGEIGVVSNVIMRARVNDWWYHPRALRKVEDDVEDDNDDEDDSEQQQRDSSDGDAQREEDDKAKWFEEGDVVKTNEGRGVVVSWDPATSTIHLVESPSNRDLRSGRRLTVLKKHGKPPKKTMYIRSVVEQPEVVQCPPLLRPKATTCVMALYLPGGYENAEHMLQVFREAFEDAKLGGLQDA